MQFYLLPLSLIRLRILNVLRASFRKCRNQAPQQEENKRKDQKFRSLIKEDVKREESRICFERFHAPEA